MLNKVIQLFKRKPKTINGGQRISIIIYKGFEFDEADMVKRYLKAHQDNNSLLMVEDADGDDVHVRVEDVVFDEQPNGKYIVTLKGEITND